MITNIAVVLSLDHRCARVWIRIPATGQPLQSNLCERCQVRHRRKCGERHLFLTSRFDALLSHNVSAR
jgi:hypothetical protein